MTVLKSPFPWFGGKSRVASIVWSRFGNTKNYVEPFAGSLAVLLRRPKDHQYGEDLYNIWPTETVNDKDGFISNLWRAIQADPDKVIHYADWPVSEVDLHARHSWLNARREKLTRKLEGDPAFYSSKVAGWWLWGISCWIGSGWCSGKGGWVVHNGELVQRPESDTSPGVFKQRPKLGKLKDVSTGFDLPPLTSWLQRLSERLRRVRVCSGDWSRVLSRSATTVLGTTGVFLDPPYDKKIRTDVYSTDSVGLSGKVREWALEQGDDPKLRIALCGYDGEHVMPDTWEEVAWRGGGYASQGKNTQGQKNQHRERIWFSPHCLKPEPKAPKTEGLKSPWERADQKNTRKTK